MNIVRRSMILGSAAALLPRAAWAATCGTKVMTEAPAGLLRPGEWAPHAQTWMAYGATMRAWGDLTDTVFDRDLSNSRHVARQDLMRMAAMISRFEPVTMLVSDSDDRAEAERLLRDVTVALAPKDQMGGDLDGSGRIYIGTHRQADDLPAIGTYPVTFLIAPMDDLWTRDTAPVFTKAPQAGLCGVNLNFNGWGQWPVSTDLCGWEKDPAKTANGVLDQFVEGDRQVASFICNHIQVPEIATWLTTEGGGLEVNGQGLGLAMASCIDNRNRNPGKSRTEIDGELRRLFGIERMLWMPGVPGEELTDWHVDFTARFATPNRIAYAFDHNWEPEDNRNEVALKAAVEAVNALPALQKARFLGPNVDLTLHSLPVPRIEEVYRAYAQRNTDLVITERSLEDFTLTTAPGYVGYYHVNGAIILGQFGDVAADLEAFETVQNLYPEHVVIQISTDGLASGGGTIHCATQEQPSM